MNEVVGNWYQIKEISDGVFWVREPGVVSFFVFRMHKQGLFIDSGLGLNNQIAEDLLRYLGISHFDVLLTHAHCDHVGLNSKASQVAISKLEWEKYLIQNENKQFEYFATEILKSGKFPILDPYKQEYVGNKSWVPSYFLTENQEICFSEWKFRVIGSPGHTCGSLMFFEEKTNFLFTGDIIYDGKMYLHLADSDFDEFKSSVSKIVSLNKLNPRMQIWPAHNTIPLPKEFLQEVDTYATHFARDKESPVATWPEDQIFLEGEIFKNEKIQIVMRKK